ncbi:MAG TPA: hypothetical protein VOA87_09900 [Thermoanaerobaculia bacterium]|nr:hypothetical protein [Thermoanaerobaculia bacterium]
MKLFGLRLAGAATLFLLAAAAHPAAALRKPATAMLPADTDGDGLTDVFEEALVRRFFPNLWMSNLQDTRSFYGCITTDPFARIPYMVEPVWYSAGSLTGLACLYPDDCLLLKVGLAYDRDFGDDVFGGGHLGDSEFYYALLSRVTIDRSVTKKNAAGQTCTAALAKSDATCWWMMVDWTSAHQGTLGEASRWSSSPRSGRSTTWRWRGRTTTSRAAFWCTTSQARAAARAAAAPCSEGRRLPPTDVSHLLAKLLRAHLKTSRTPGGTEPVCC